RTAAALWRFWQGRGHIEEGRLQLERLLEARSGSEAAQAGARLTVARCAWLQGDFDTLRRSVEASMPVHRKLEDAYSVAFALTILGAATSAQGDHEQGQALLAEAPPTARAAGDSWR